MSMNMGDGGSDGTMSEINVTPLVDVMLVLLIIFMVTAPLMQQGVEVDLPQTNAQPIEKADDDNLVLSIKKDQTIHLSRKGSTVVQIPLEELEEKLRLNPKVQKDKEVFLEADRTVPYGFVVDVMAKMKNAGVDKMGLITEPAEEKKE